MDYFILAGGWAIYFVLHSTLAAEGVKRFANRLLGKSFRFYRLFYSTISSAGLVGLLVFNSSIRASNFFDSGGIVRFLSLGFTVFGVMTIQLAFRQYKIKSFLGFAEEKSELKIGGILTHIRHPIYTGLILITIGFFLFIPNAPTLISSLSIVAYMPVGIYLEEQKLISAFGERYLDYKRRVPALIPDFSASTFKESS